MSGKKLETDPDREYFLKGIEEGFFITDICPDVKPVEINNHHSAVRPDNLQKVNECELREGRYVHVQSKPTIVSPLAAVDKDDGTVHLIHDASRPENCSLNDCALNSDSVKYQSVQDAVQIVTTRVLL